MKAKKKMFRMNKTWPNKLITGVNLLHNCIAANEKGQFEITISHLSCKADLAYQISRTKINLTSQGADHLVVLNYNAQFGEVCCFRTQF